MVKSVKSAIVPFELPGNRAPTRVGGSVLGHVTSTTLGIGYRRRTRDLGPLEHVDGHIAMVSSMSVLVEDAVSPSLSRIDTVTE